MTSESDLKLLAYLIKRNVQQRDHVGFRLFHRTLGTFPGSLVSRSISVLLWDDGRKTVEYYNAEGRIQCRHLMPGFDPARIINALHLIEIKPREA